MHRSAIVVSLVALTLSACGTSPPKGVARAPETSGSEAPVPALEPAPAEDIASDAPQAKERGAGRDELSRSAPEAEARPGLATLWGEDR